LDAVTMRFFIPGRLPSIPETRRRAMMAAGDRLLDVLNIESQRRREDESLLDWKQCRRTIDRRAEDYARAVAQWREAIEESAVEYALVPLLGVKVSRGLLGVVTSKVAGLRHAWGLRYAR